MNEPVLFSRKKQREFAFQVIYALIFHETQDVLETILTHIDSFPDQRKKNFSPQNAPFAWELIYGVQKKKDTLDKCIAQYSTNWKVSRIAKIELAILRLACYELSYRADIPPKVSINEAVELAKLFGDANSKTFVNGILDSLAKDIAHDQFRIES